MDRRPEPWRRCGEVQAAWVSPRVPALTRCSCPQLRDFVIDLRLTFGPWGPARLLVALAVWTLHRLHRLPLPWESGQVCQQPGCKHLVPLVLICCWALSSKFGCYCWPASEYSKYACVFRFISTVPCSLHFAKTCYRRAVCRGTLGPQSAGLASSSSFLSSSSPFLLPYSLSLPLAPSLLGAGI